LYSCLAAALPGSTVMPQTGSAMDLFCPLPCTTPDANLAGSLLNFAKQCLLQK
jgi:hypothetical protein